MAEKFRKVKGWRPKGRCPPFGADMSSAYDDQLWVNGCMLNVKEARALHKWLGKALPKERKK